MSAAARQTGAISVERDDAGSWAAEPKRDTLATWVVGGVATMLLAALMAYGAALTRTLDDTVKRVTALETAFAALQASNVEQHRAMIDGLSRIERQLEGQPQQRQAR